MVLYFTGTGNSRHIASRIAEALSEELFSINERIKTIDTSPVTTNERLILVTPTYAWRIPRIVRDWLLKTDFPAAKQVWFVMDCGSEIGGAAKYNRKLCQVKKLAYMGTTQIVMPENYIAMFGVPQADEARAIVAKAEPDIHRAIAYIAAAPAFPPPRNGPCDRLMSTAVNPVFYPLFVKSSPFTVSNACIGCGQCVRRCPLNNITLKNGKPVWGKDCTHCMACICYCPTEAIEYGKKTLGKPRYHFEAL